MNLRKFFSVALLCAASGLAHSAWAQNWQDVTDKVANPSFEVQAGAEDLEKSWTPDVTGWTIETSTPNPANSQVGVGANGCKLQGVDDKGNPKGIQLNQASEGTNFFYVRTNWNNNVKFSISQNIAELPAGFYKLNIKAANFHSGNANYVLTLSESDGVSFSNTTLESSDSWTDWEVTMYKKSATSTLSISAAMTPLTQGGGQHYQLLIDDVKLYYSPDLGATKENPVDISFLLTNAEGTSLNGWTITGNSNLRINSGQHWDGTERGYLDTNKWNDGSWTGDASQSIFVPNGKYSVRVAGRGANSNVTMKVYANSDSNPIDISGNGGVIATDGTWYANLDAATEAGAECKNYGWTYGTAETYVSDNELKLGVNVSNNAQYRWASFSDFKVLYYGDDPSFLIEELKKELLATNDATVDPTANTGDAPFLFSKSVADAITDAKNAAKTVYNNEAATLEDVQAAIDALKKLDFTLNKPGKGQRFNLIFHCDGHDSDGNAVTFIEGGRDGQGNYGIKYLTSQNVNYAQAFTLTSSDAGINYYHLSQTDAKGQPLYMTTSTLGYDNPNFHDGLRVTTDSEKALDVELRPQSDGTFVLWNTMSNKAIAHNGNNNPDMFTNNNATFSIVEASEASVELNINAGKYATRIFPFTAELPEGVKAYSCASVNNNELVLDPVTVVEANVPYILEATEDVNKSLAGWGLAKQDTYTAGLLTGTYAKGAKVPTGSHVLQTQNEKQAFYVVGGTEVDFIPYRAYLTVPAGNEVKAFFFGDDNATAINGVEDAESVTVVGRYNAAGVKVDTLVKGLNILKMSDGTVKKVLVK